MCGQKKKSVFPNLPHAIEDIENAPAIAQIEGIHGSIPSNTFVPQADRWTQKVSKPDSKTSKGIFAQ